MRAQDVTRALHGKAMNHPYIIIIIFCVVICAVAEPRLIYKFFLLLTVPVLIWYLIRIRWKLMMLKLKGIH